MRPSKIIVLLAAAICFTLTGCNSKPYYKMEGGGEGKKLVVYKKDDSTITIPLGTGMGGGLSKFISKGERPNADGQVEKTVEDQGVKFTINYKPGINKATIKDVFYDGKQLKSW